MMPGPLLTLLINESPRRGFWAGPLLILGHGILEFSLVIALLLGLSPLLEQRDFRIMVSLVGGAILFWMAAGMLRALPSLVMPYKPTGPPCGRLVLSGALLSLANPYWLIWWSTVGLGFITNSLKAGLTAWVFFYAGHILADLAWFSLVAYSLERGRRFISNRIYRGVIGACAALLMFFAGLFVLDAVKALLH